MSSIQYQCKNHQCGHQWTGNVHAAVCPKCGEDQIKQLAANRQKQYMWGAAVLFLLAGALLLIYFLLLDKNPHEGSTYRVLVSQVEDYVQVDLERHYEQDGKPTSEILAPDAFATGLDSLQFRDGNGGRVAFIDGNRVYPCKDADVIFGWRNSVGYPLLDRDDTLKLVSFHLPGKSPNPKANCGDTLQLRILEVKPVVGGSIEVVTNMDGKADVMVSINGRGGQYFKSNSFPIPGESLVLNVWAYVAGKDTAAVPPVNWSLNGDKVYPIRKEAMKPDARATLEREFLRLANAFGNAPDRDAAAAFNQFLARNAVEPTVVLNGDPLEGGISEMLNRLRIDFQNDGKRFRIRPGSVEMRENGQIVKFEFVDMVTG